jgi:hypothetical protein
MPLEELLIETIAPPPKKVVVWLKSRSVRASQAGGSDEDVEPTWAAEALGDPGRCVSLTQGEALEVLGWSKSARAPVGVVLKVWIVPLDLKRGVWMIVDACVGNDDAHFRYSEVQ